MSQTNEQAYGSLPLSWKPLQREGLIRIGSENDGGYVVTENSLSKSDYLISLGISYDWTFEKDFNKLTKCQVHSYDHSISLGYFLKLSINDVINYFRSRVRKININVILLPLGYKNFFKNGNKHFREKIGSDRSKETNFEKIFSRIPEGKKAFLKIDIEGDEYRVLDDLNLFYHRIPGIVVEFHDVDTSFDSVNDHIEKLKKFFDIVHVHINNCSGIGKNNIPRVIEVTFENKNIFSGESRLSNLQYPIFYLDKPNDIYIKDYELRFEG